MRGGVTSFRSNGGSAARKYLEKDTSRPDDYYLKEGSGLADHWVLDGDGSLTSKQGVDGDSYEAWVDWTDLETGASKGRPRTRTVINAQGENIVIPASPRFQEMTVNCDKTLSIAAALHPDISAALDAAQEDAACTMLEYLAVNSRTRVGNLGEQVYVAPERLEAMSVVHHTNRAGDPHRHIHLQVSTRVFAQGKWRGLDGSIFYKQQGVLRGLGEAAIVANPQLQQALAAHGFTFDPATGAVVELAEYREVLSKRAVQIQANKEELEAAWRLEHPGMEPGPRVVRSWDRQAWALNRPDKTPDTMPSEELWRAELAAAGYQEPEGPATVVPLGTGVLDRDAIAAEAVALVGAKRSTWGTPDLGEQVARLVAASGVVAERAVLVQTVEDLTERAVQLCTSVAPQAWADGDLPAGYRHLTSEHVVRVEREIGEYLSFAALVKHRDDSGEHSERVDLDQEQVEQLVTAANQHRSEDEAVRVPDAEGQRAALRAMSGNHRLVVVTGAAGSGKTTVLKAAKAVADGQGRTQLLVAPTMKAAQVAGSEVGSPASSVHKLLRENGWRWNGDDERSWHQLAVGDIDPDTGAPWPGVKPEYRLTRTTQLVVDEAGMLAQDTAHKLLALSHKAGSQVVFLGDRAQLAAVGRGGVLDMAAKTARAVVDLDQVHRFTDRKYADVSLMMREHRNLEEAFTYLVQHELVQIHASEKDALDVVAAQYIAESAQHTVALTVATNSEATTLNEVIRASREALGEVSAAATRGCDGLGIGQGDVVMVRRNDTQLGVANREVFTVARVSSQGELTVTDPDGKYFTLPAEYVADHVHLGYAVTGHGNQGITTTTSHTVLGDGTDAAGAYVGMTRGREANALHVVASDLDEAFEQFKEAFNRDYADRGLAAARQDLAEQLAPYQPALKQQPAPQPALSAAEKAQCAQLAAKYQKTWAAYTAEQSYRTALQARQEAIKQWKAAGNPDIDQLQGELAKVNSQIRSCRADSEKILEEYRSAVYEEQVKPSYSIINELREARTAFAQAGFFKKSAAKARLAAAEHAVQEYAPGVPVPENLDGYDQIPQWRAAAIQHQVDDAPLPQEYLQLTEQAHALEGTAQRLDDDLKLVKSTWDAFVPAATAPKLRYPELRVMTPERLAKNIAAFRTRVEVLQDPEVSPERARKFLALANQQPTAAPARTQPPARPKPVTPHQAPSEYLNPTPGQEPDSPMLG